jgi:hypothetical protein
MSQCHLLLCPIIIYKVNISVLASVGYSKEWHNILFTHKASYTNSVLVCDAITYTAYVLYVFNIISVKKIYPKCKVC